MIFKNISFNGYTIKQNLFFGCIRQEKKRDESTTKEQEGGGGIDNYDIRTNIYTITIFQVTLLFNI